MADVKISALTELTAPAAGDMLAGVDVSDTTMAATGTTKRLPLSRLKTFSGGLTLTALKDASYTAVAGEHVLCTFATGAAADRTVTLPASPAAGDRVRVTLVSALSSYAVLIAGGTLASGRSLDEIALVSSGDSVELEYSGSAWLILDDALRPLAADAYASASQNVSHNTATKLTVNTSVDTTKDSIGVFLAGSNRMVARRSGWHVVSGFAALDLLADTTSKFLLLYVDGAYSRNMGVNLISVASGTTASAVRSSVLIYLTRGQYVEFYVQWIVSGGSGTKATNVTTQARPSLAIAEQR